MSALCREYGISRKTGYKWIERYRRGEQMCDRSRRPINTPNKMTDKTESLVIQIRLQHPAWGARKIFRILQNQNAKPVPSVGTIGNILRRNGLISPQATAQHKPYQRFVRANPNELWQMDFKALQMDTVPIAHDRKRKFLQREAGAFVQTHLLDLGIDAIVPQRAERYLRT